MPYIEVEELPEGVEEADVVTWEEHEAAINRLREVTESAAALKAERDELRRKYADAFLHAPVDGAGAPNGGSAGSADTVDESERYDSDKLFSFGME